MRTCHLLRRVMQVVQIMDNTPRQSTLFDPVVELVLNPTGVTYASDKGLGVHTRLVLKQSIAIDDLLNAMRIVGVDVDILGTVASASYVYFRSDEVRVYRST